MKYFWSAVPIVAVALAISPASAASMNCGGDGMAKASTMVMGMMMGTPERMAGDKQMMMANSAMSKGDMRGCNKALAGIKPAKK